MAHSLTVTKRPLDLELMPPPPSKRIKRPPKVLSEDEYTSGLSYIVARDYFPGLLESEAQRDYLDALDAGDDEWMEEAGQRVKQIMTPRNEQRQSRPPITPRRTSLQEAANGNTPRGWIGGTPASSDVGDTPMRKRPHAEESVANSEDERPPYRDTQMSLSAFQAKYTSEDNESFNTVVDEQNDKRRHKYRWLWSSNKMPSKQQIAQRRIKANEESSLALAAPGFFSARNHGSTDDEKALVKPPREPSENLNERPATINYLKHHRARNGLFFAPDDIADVQPHLRTQAEMRQSVSRAPAKAVNVVNTRMALDTEGLAADLEVGEGQRKRPPSPTISAIDAAIRGHSHPGLQKGGAYADSTIGSDSAVGSETPRVRGYAFVDEDPTDEEMRALQGGSEAQSKSGELKGIDHDALLHELIHQSGGEGESQGSHGGPFSISEPSERERLHYAMVEKQNEGKRASTETAKIDRLATLKGQGVAATPRFLSSPRVGSMPKTAKTPGNGAGAGLTPAAKKLWEKIGRTPKR